MITTFRTRRVEPDDDDTWSEVLALDGVLFRGCEWENPRTSVLFVTDAYTGPRTWQLAAYGSAVELSAKHGPDHVGTWFFDRAGVAVPWRGHRLQRRLIRRRLDAARAEHGVRAVTYTMPTLTRSANNLIACGFRLYRPRVLWYGADVLYWQRPVVSRA